MFEEASIGKCMTGGGKVPCETLKSIPFLPLPAPFIYLIPGLGLWCISCKYPTQIQSHD